MEKVITFTLDKGAGEQELVDTTMGNIKHELEAEAQGMSDEDFPIEYTIRIEKRYTQKQLEKMPDYNG